MDFSGTCVSKLTTSLRNATDGFSEVLRHSVNLNPGFLNFCKGRMLILGFKMQQLSLNSEVVLPKYLYLTRYQ
jgi:hypothetical protein